MPSQRSLFSSNQVLFLLVILNFVFFFHYVSGNDQAIVIPFPAETPVAGYPNEKLVRLRMAGGIPATPNTLVCTGFNLTWISATNSLDQFWIKQIKAVVTQNDIAMNLYSCNSLQQNPCSCALQDRSLLFSWYRYTPPFRFDSTFFPTGFNVGGDSQIKKLFLEVRYANTLPNPDTANGFDIQITRIRPYYVASLYSVLVPFAPGSGSRIPAGETAYTLETCVPVPSNHPNTIRLIAYRTNAQTRGVLGSGYLKSQTTGEIVELGRGNPTFPQAFLAPAKSVQLNPGDLIMIRCVFNTVTGFIGTTQGSQACIYNIMFITPYFVPAFTTTSFLRGTCTAEQKASFPASSTTLLPDNAILRMHAEYGNQTGIVTIDSTRTMNLDMETFLSIYP